MIAGKVLNSPIRWAGSKKKVLVEMLNAFKPNRENYIECFLGSGVVLINVLKKNNTLNYKNFYVNDVNPHIINFYKLLQNNPHHIIKQIGELVEVYNNYDTPKKEEYYYELRMQFNEEKDLDNKSILFYFLMKTGFNGVYRENKAGKFNVPFGRKEKIVLNADYLMELSKLIQPVNFYNLDYKTFLNKMKEDGKIDNSFMYFDPPYLPDDSLVSQKQELYTKDIFDHKLFVRTITELKGKYIMISMSDSKQADEIYGKFIKNNMKEILRTINPIKLFSSTEIAFTNYKIELNSNNEE
ncbi:MAG TPA: Dam family site-specific DNA-(adenine-N6)-methyltransferase [Candidatus Scybalousia intestinigallinarum]|nr:Dam family site-specific DNA-(adenine-N6)-methyltransferase [Candidatus Scybalousia intestinigallinarum]